MSCLKYNVKLTYFTKTWGNGNLDGIQCIVNVGKEFLWWKCTKKKFLTNISIEKEFLCTMHYFQNENENHIIFKALKECYIPHLTSDGTVKYEKKVLLFVK